MAQITKKEKRHNFVSPFSERVYHIIKKVPRGKVTTYKAIAEALGTKAYRAVGNALNRNPNAPEVPCHRVVCSDGSIGGYSEGVNEKIKLLQKENVLVKAGLVVDFGRKLTTFAKK